MRPRSFIRGGRLSALSILVVARAGDGGAATSGTETDTDGTTGASGSTTTMGSSGSTGDPEPPDPPTAPDCVGTVAASPSGAPFDVATVTFSAGDLPSTMGSPSELETICPGRPRAVLNAGTVLYRPDDGGSWPAARVPLIVFAHGQGQGAANYEYLFTELARRGFAVLSLELLGIEPEDRQNSIACALSWIGWDNATRGGAPVDVVGTATPSDVGFGQIEVTGMMPACWGQDDIPVEGSFSLVLDVSGGVVESPPSVTIDIPSTVSCPSSVDLDATASDPDGDLDVVRWYVDDVLIDGATTSLTFTEQHEVRAVAFDDRGAATTATKTVDCI